MLMASASRWLRAAAHVRYEFLGVALVTAAGLFLRVWQLDSIPPGLHGDEASTGLRAGDILQFGWIGVFDLQHGLGQPAGAEYWTAGLVWLFDNNIFVIRLAMALLGAATLPLAYVFYRMVAGRTVALIALPLLAFSEWHLFFSRIALPPVSMVLFQVVVAILLFSSLKRRRWWLFLLTGAVLGLGVYTYSSYPYFAISIAIFMVYWLATNRSQVSRRLLGQLGLAAVVALLLVLPMFRFAMQHSDRYFEYPKDTAIFNDYRYENSGYIGKLDVLLDSGRDFVRYTVFDSKFDDTDGSGVGPMLDPVTAALLGLGILFALRRWRHPGLFFCLMMVVLLTLPGILTFSRGTSRRAIGVLPFLPLLAALPLAALIEWTTDKARARIVGYAVAVGSLAIVLLLGITGYLQGPLAWILPVILVPGLAILIALNERETVRGHVRVVAYAVTISCIAAVFAVSTHSYFSNFADDPRSAAVFGRDLVQASRYIDDLPTGTLVYFYSEDWSFEYEIRRYLAPGKQGVDLSDEFSIPSLERLPVRESWAAHVFIGGYLDQFELVSSRFPGGGLFEEADEHGATILRAYHLPGTGTPPEPIDLRCERLKETLSQLLAAEVPVEELEQLERAISDEC